MGVLIIAEAGVNHNGDMGIAIDMIEAAAKAGVDIIKFQTFKAKNIVSKQAPKAEYQITNSQHPETQYEMLRKLELSQEQHKVLIEHCQKRNIRFLSTPFDLESIEVLQNFDMPFWKIPSGEITNLPYLIQIAKTGKPVLVSTGMCTLDEVKETVSILKKYNAGEITVLHCNTDYPTRFEDVNLQAMLQIRDQVQVKVGYSDHTPGIEVPIAAVAMGAAVIEKHFTLDKNMIGPDHKASLEPAELKNMVSAIRNIEMALGSGMKTPTQAEYKNIAVARKSIVANCAIKTGELLTEQNITVKRPGTGISPMRWFDVLGTNAIKDFDEDELITI